MPITFGSVGDIIAAVQVAYKLVEILSTQTGAQRQIQDLAAELRLFRGLLEGLLLYWQTRKQSAQLDALRDKLLPVIRETSGDIRAFLERIVTKYGRALRSPSSRSPRDVAYMLQWHMLEQDRITRLQNKLRMSKELIATIHSHAMLIAQEEDQKLVSDKLYALRIAEEQVAADLDNSIKHLEQKLDQQSQAVRVLSKSVESIGASLLPITGALASFSTMLAYIYAELLTQRALHYTLNPYGQNSAIVEDALGYAIPIPLEIVGSWNTLHSILLDKFDNKPGRALVLQRRYVLRDDLNGNELSQDKPLGLLLRPGQRINMSVICLGYFSDEQYVRACPRCRKSTLIANGSIYVCLDSQCGIEIERVADTEGDVALIQYKRSERDGFDFLDPLEVDVTEDDALMVEFDQSLPADPFCATAHDDGPETFKRVRFLTRWEYRAESRGRKVFRTNKWYWWTANCPEVAVVVRALATAIACRTSPELLSYAADGQDITWKQKFYITVYFVGPTLKQSRPVIWIFAMNKAERIRLRRICEEINWVRDHPILLLATTRHELFHDTVRWIHDFDQRNRQKALEIAGADGLDSELRPRVYDICS